MGDTLLDPYSGPNLSQPANTPNTDVPEPILQDPKKFADPYPDVAKATLGTRDLPKGESEDEAGEHKKGKWGKKKKKDKKKAEKPKTVKLMKLFRFADTKDKIMMTISVICAVILGCALPGFSFLFGELLDDLAGDATQVSEKVSFICLVMTIIGVSEWIIASIAVACFSISGERQMRVMRRSFFAAILNQEIAFFDLTKAGELTNHLSSDMTLISSFMGAKVPNLIQYLSTFFLSYIFAFVSSWQLTLLMLAVMPFIAISGGIMTKLISSATNKAQEVYAEGGGIAQEVLSSIRTVQAFDGMDRECSRYGERIAKARDVGIKKGLWGGLAQGVTMFFLFSSYAVAFYYGSWLIEWGVITGGKVVSVFFAVLIGAFQLAAAGPIFEAIAECKGAGYKVFEIIDRVPLMNAQEDGPGQILDNLQGNIEFRNVEFRYPSRTEVPIFSDLNLKIHSGQTVALVGPSGSGKSSIVSLIERFYDVDGGQILVDGVPIKDLKLNWWRSQVGIVTQEPTLFAASVLDNIAYANPSATKEQIIQACKDAFIHDVISKLPNGYDTEVGEAGSQLSGGQKQRVAIARAIIKNPKILLLDEATSALDRGSEMIVQEALQNVMRGRTVITIAHRLVTIQDADVICYVEPRDPKAPEGSPAAFSRILESGTHDELMQMKGEYTQMVATQQQAEQTPASPGGTIPSASKIARKFDDDEVVIDIAPEKKKLTKEEKKLKEKEGKKAQKKKKKAGVKRTIKENKPEWFWLLLGTLGAAIAGTSYPIYAILFSEVVGVFYEPNLKDVVWKWCLLFIGLGTLNLISLCVKIYSLNRAGEVLTWRLRTKLFKALVRQDIGFYDMPGNESGALCARLAGDTTEIQHLWGGAIGVNVQSAVCMIGGLVIAFIVSWKLALVTATSVPLMIMAGVINTKFMWGFAQKSGEVLEEAQQVASESISGCRTVYAFNMQKAQVDRYDHLLSGPSKDALKKGVVSGFFFGFSQFIIFGAFALTFWYGGELVAKGELDFTQVLKCGFAVLMGAMGVGEVYSLAGDTAEAVQAASRVYELIDRVPSIDVYNQNGVMQTNSSAAAGSFKGVQFSYPSRPDVTILKGLNLDYYAGQRIALLGSTGCGKSTIISLLMRFYDPSAGEVCPDGINLKELHLTDWRRHIGIVSQEPILFDDTIANNIKYGKPDATDEEMMTAARQANIHHVIQSLPEGYHTNVGAKGSQLSGGQKQRVAIARCVIRKPKVLLLDEATSALDNVAEQEVQAALDDIIMTDKMTVLTVAHRLSTIKNCDVIVIMDQGKILEIGSHEELYAQEGDYRRRYDQYYGASVRA